MKRILILIPLIFAIGLRHQEARRRQRRARPEVQPTGLDPADGLEQLE